MEIRVLAIINPTSGRGNITGYVEQIKKYLEKQNMTVKVKFTKKEYNARKIVINNIEETDLILVCGGDGTFNETVSALMELETKDISIAYIPMGTTNDLAQSLKIPIKDISVTKNLLKSKAKVVDVGKFNNKYFCYVAAFGIITDVAYKTSQKAKNKYGRLAYYLRAIGELFRIRKYKTKTKIKFDDEEIEGEFIYGGISNSESIAGFKWYNQEDISLDDGKFEALFIRKPKRISGYFRLLSDFKNKDYMANRDFVYFKANKITITTAQNVDWTIDGEYAGNLNFVNIENCNKAIELAICDSAKKQIDSRKESKNE
ncbi:MAG: diacylglycerol/lipid kinase family protein [Clostridia bacterium]